MLKKKRKSNGKKLVTIDHLALYAFRIIFWNWIKVEIVEAFLIKT